MAAGSSPWLLQSFEGCYGRIQTCIPFGGGGVQSPMGVSWSCRLGLCSEHPLLPLPQGAAGKDGEAGAQGPPGPTVSINKPLATHSHAWPLEKGLRSRLPPPHACPLSPRVPLEKEVNKVPPALLASR